MILDDRAAGTTTTAAPRRFPVRGVVAWSIIAALVLGVAWVALQVAATAPNAYRALDPESPRDTGTLALAEILRDRGTEVDVVRSRVDAARLIDDGTTLVMSNPYTLSDEGLAELTGPADRVVFLSVGASLLGSFDLGTYAPGTTPAVEAECDIAEFSRVGTILPDQLFAPAPGVTACFPASATSGAAVLVAERDGTTVSAVDGSRLFTNAELDQRGNAALALALLGQTDHVVWYVPSLADSDIEGDSPETLGGLTPDWVTPAILLLLLTGTAAALWRGRRFGPLVAETLPVTVRASETMLGRARLTARSGDAAHAAGAIRDGVRRRLARRLGLSDRSTPDEVSDAAADRLRIPRGSLQTLLDGPLPTDDAALVDLARRLSDLEASVDESLTPRRTRTASPSHDPSPTTEDEAARDR